MKLAHTFLLAAVVPALLALGGCVVDPPQDRVVVHDREVVHVDEHDHDHDRHCDHDDHCDH